MAPPNASNFAAQYDILFYTLCALTAFFTIAVAGAIIFLAIRYKEGSKADRSRPLYEDARLETIWTVVPLVLGVVMFFAGASLFMKMKTPPPDAQEVFVIGKQWMWHIEHANGIRENNTLHVPVGRAIKVTMISQDVLHAFYIPAFRVQMGVVPGRYTQMWFTPTKAGEYHMFCAMYCGTQHSEMGGKVIAMEPAEWAAWAKNGGMSMTPMTMEQAGARTFSVKGCNNCHGATDNLRAPSLYSIYGKRRVFTDGTALLADDAYLRESIINPWNHITQGFDRTMPAYQGQLSEEEVLNLISYIKVLGQGIAVPTGSTVAAAGQLTSSSKVNVNDVMSVGAIQAQATSPEATPTMRGKTLSVGAVAAQQGSEGR